jgi:hypothetical protein
VARPLQKKQKSPRAQEQQEHPLRTGPASARPPRRRQTPRRREPKSQQHPLRGGRRTRRKSAADGGGAFRLSRVTLTRWSKLLLGVALLPVCWIFSETFFESFSRAAATHRFWAAEEFWFFALGVVLWLVTFFGLPRPVVVYVFGHEATHALWVWASGGKVSGFRVGRDGGYVISDRVNIGISLAPYFFPIYSLGVFALWGVLALLGLDGWRFQWMAFGVETWPFRWLLFALVGATWAFHLSFTCWMIPKDQPDLRLHGTFFSLVVIYLANLVVLAAFFIVACPQITWAGFGSDLLGNAAAFAVWLRALLS